nr:hypothetical protein [Tanacetum cinerariifolium]
MKHIPLKGWMMKDCKHYGELMIENHLMDRSLKEVLMIERVIHTVKTDMVRLVVESECVGKIVDAFDKATGLSDGLQPEQVDLNYVHALNKPHLHEIRVVPTSLDYHLNPIYTIKECPSCGALYNKSCGCSKGGFVDRFVRDRNKTLDSSQRPPYNCLKCGNPEFESSNDNTNVVNAPQEPLVFNQDPGENSSQSPPHIDHHCCYGCGDSLDSIFCHQFTCESCGNGAHYGYNCLLKVSTISNPKPCHNQNVDKFPQTLPSFYPTCYLEMKIHSLMIYPIFVDDSPNNFNPPPQPPTYSYEFYGNDAHYSHDYLPQVPFMYNPEPKFNHFAFLKTPKVLLLAWDRVSKIKDAFGNKQYKPEDVQELIQKLFNVVQNIHEELAEYINTPSWNRPAFYNYDDDDDDEDYTTAITPVLSTEEPDLVPIPSESEGIPDNMCDVPFRDNSPPLDILKDQFEDFFDFNDDSTSIDDDYFSIDDIDYVEASPLNSELVILEEVKDDILREKLLNIHLLIDKIESLNDNSTLDCVLKSPSSFPIPIEDSDSFFEKSNNSLPYSDNSLPEFETFSDHTEETTSGSTTTHDDNSLPKYDSFLFEIEPDQGELTSVGMEDNLGEPRVHVPNVLPTHPTHMLDLDFIPSDNSLPKYEIFCFDIEEKNSGSTTIHADISLLVCDNFHFKIDPDSGDLTSIVDSGIRENVHSVTNVNLSPEDD